MKKLPDLGPLFSLQYGEEDFVKIAAAEKSSEKDVYTADGLAVTVRKQYFGDNAVYWDITLCNPTDHNSRRIRSLRTVDVSVPLSQPVLGTTRGTWTENLEYDFMKDVRPLTEAVTLTCGGGRSSQGTMPYFELTSADGNDGLLCALGWSGQWSAEIVPENGTVRVSGGIADVDFYLLPGESYYLGSGIAVPFHDGARAAHNRFLKIMRHFSPLGKPGRPKHLPVCFTFWGDVPQKDIIGLAELWHRQAVDFDVFWIDAGWFTPPDVRTEAWVAFPGDWTPMAAYCPDRTYAKSSKVLHDLGYKFLLWYEPERSSENAAFAAAHPEAFLHIPADQEPFYCGFRDSVPEEFQWRLKSCAVNLGCEAGYRFMWDVLYNGIRDHGLDWLRIDFNFYPLPYWNLNDTQSRIGITQIKYVNGLYRLLDGLMKAYPHLMIDNCASGGSRLDIEMHKYSVPLWRSDCQCGGDARRPEVLQSQMMGTAEWFVACSGAGHKQALADPYRLRSAYASGMPISVHADEPESVRPAILQEIQAPNSSYDFAHYMLMRKEFDAVRDCYLGDYYPLSKQSPDDLTIWCAWQFENDGVGVVQAFRRAECAEADQCLPMHVEPGCVYDFHDCNTGRDFTMRGEELANGLNVRLEEPRSSLVLRYEMRKA